MHGLSKFSVELFFGCPDNTLNKEAEAGLGSNVAEKTFGPSTDFKDKSERRTSLLRT